MSFYAAGQRLRCEVWDFGCMMGIGWKRRGKRFGLRFPTPRTLKQKARIRAELKRRIRAS